MSEQSHRHRGSVHGVTSWAAELQTLEVLVHAIESRVAIMNNGTRKGGQPDVMKVIHSAPGLEDLWQLHFSQLSGQEYTVPGLFIANLVDEPQPVMPVAPMPPPNPGRDCACSAGSQWSRILDQGVSAAGRVFRGHEWSKRLLEDVQSTSQRVDRRTPCRFDPVKKLAVRTPKSWARRAHGVSRALTQPKTAELTEEVRTIPPLIPSRNTHGGRLCLLEIPSMRRGDSSRACTP